MKNTQSETDSFTTEQRAFNQTSLKISEGEPDSFVELPQRYVIKNSSAGRILTCLEAPNLSVHVEAGFTVSSSAAHKSDPGTIYLDGVAQCGPFMDLEKQIYNFDHHEGCIRSFTLSTCEQVLVMILKGLDLRGRNWHVFANEPDLDTVLAIWLLLNHLRIHQKDSDRLQFLYALVRLEGIIDSHGLEMIELSGFPPELSKKTKKVIDFLRAEEIELKKEAKWEEKDNPEYTALMLQKIDRIIYRSFDFIDFKALKELARVDIMDNRIAVVVEADLGIYELEPYLNNVYGESLGLVILKKAAGAYTLRRMDPFMPGDLNDVYQKLNYMDPAVRCRTNGNRWGGSGDIGGSPRGIGTKLTPEEIAQTCRDAFQKSNFSINALRFFYALITVGGIIGAAIIAKLYLFSGSWPSGSDAAELLLKTDFLFFSVLLILTIFGVIVFSRGRLWRFGIRFPAGKDWWLLLPIVVFAAMVGGVYFPRTAFHWSSFNKAALYMTIAVPLASELLFRGLAHGILALGTHIQSCNSRWSLSYPAVAAAILYTAFIAYLALLPNRIQEVFEIQTSMRIILAAFAFGLATGFVRERSQSVFPAILFHALAMVALFVSSGS
jgi:membrane protease YdiL (CAAX protease family)